MRAAYGLARRDRPLQGIEDEGRAPRDACAELVALAAAQAASGIGARDFVGRLGTLGAGIRPGPRGFVDLATGGGNPLPGRGFRPELDDGTDGQIRHFCGIAEACCRLGPGLARWLSVHLGRDSPASADGRLTDVAVDFVRRLRGGELAVADAPAWLREALCPPAAKEPRDDAPVVAGA